MTPAGRPPRLSPEVAAVVARALARPEPVEAGVASLPAPQPGPFHDPLAEDAVAGVVANTCVGITYVDQILTADDFYQPWCGRVFTVSLEITNVVNLDARVAALVAVARVDEALLRRLIADSPVMWDAAPWARRVAAAAARRRLALRLDAAREALGAGAPTGEVVASLTAA